MVRVDGLCERCAAKLRVEVTGPIRPSVLPVVGQRYVVRAKPRRVAGAAPKALPRADLVCCPVAMSL